MIDHPIYDRSQALRSSVIPGQKWTIFNNYHWFVDRLGQINRNQWRPNAPNCLFGNDSVDIGGNQVDHDDCVGTLAEKQIHRSIWVAANGGWNLPNELAFLASHLQQIRSAGQIELILNRWDFWPRMTNFAKL